MKLIKYQPMKKQILIFFLLIISITISAQADFRPGYVIKSVGDTIIGEIDYRSDLRMGEICTFRKNKNEKTIEFLPEDIYGFRFIDSKYFISKKVNLKTYFLEYLINGKVNIYYLRDSYSDHYYIDKDGEKLIELPYTKEVRNNGKIDYTYESKQHIGILNYYMNDAPELFEQISKIKEPEHDVLIRIAEKYHNAVCDGRKCIIYEKKLPAFKVNVEFLAGTNLIQNEFTGGVLKRFFTYGALAHIWLPRLSERVYFKTGFETFAFGNENLIFFPFQFEYIFPTGIIRPKIALGYFLTVYSYQLTTCSTGSIGANIKLGKNICLSLNTDCIFTPNNIFFIPDKYFSTSLTAGLNFSF